MYDYTYLLSPAQTWAEFGNLEIVINTPYYLHESSLSGFEKTETGYAYSQDGLPEGDLTFELSEQAPTPSVNLQLVLIIAAIAIVLIFLILWLRLRKKEKKPNA